MEFCKFAAKNGAENLSSARDLAHDYIQSELEKGKSAYTLKLERSALAKLYGCSGDEIYQNLPKRSRADITRSREKYQISEKTGKKIKNSTTESGLYSEKNHPDLTAFMGATGLRRCELTTLTGDQMRVEGSKVYLDLRKGQSKGGRIRSVPVLDGGKKTVVEYCLRAGDGLVWSSLPSHVDIHYYRSQYATTLYKELARPIETLTRDQKYFCRGDLKGVVYDRDAMLEVSKALGHNRINVIAAHYLRATEV